MCVSVEDFMVVEDFFEFFDDYVGFVVEVCLCF